MFRTWRRRWRTTTTSGTRIRAARTRGIWLRHSVFPQGRAALMLNNLKDAVDRRWGRKYADGRGSPADEASSSPSHL
eukprot:3012589-Alexandrium_andersonii.AAC.1